MVSRGISRSTVMQELGLKKSTLKTWIYKDRISDPFWEPNSRQAATPPLKGSKVSDVRIALSMMDEGRSYAYVNREVGPTYQTLRRWRDDPRYREATLEYNETFAYDHEDLLDRAVVAQHLCSLTLDVSERLDLLMAAVGFGDSTDDFSIPSRNETRRR